MSQAQDADPMPYLDTVNAIEFKDCKKDFIASFHNIVPMVERLELKCCQYRPEVTTDYTQFRHLKSLNIQVYSGWHFLSQLRVSTPQKTTLHFQALEGLCNQLSLLLHFMYNNRIQDSKLRLKMLAVKKQERDEVSFMDTTRGPVVRYILAAEQDINNEE